MTSTLKLPIVHCEYCGQRVVYASTEDGTDRVPVEVDEAGEPIPTRPNARTGRVQLHRAVVPMFEGEDLGRTTLEVYPLSPAGQVQEDLEVWQDHRTNCPR